MRLEISLKEVQEFLSNYYNINVELKNKSEGKIEVSYFATLVLTIKEVKKDEVLFHYEVNGLVDLLAKGAHFFLEKKLGDSPIEWNSNTDEVTIDLKKIPALSEFLKFLYISELRFVEENILLVLNVESNFYQGKD